MAGIGAALTAAPFFPAPAVFTRPRVLRQPSRGRLAFRPAQVQRGVGPNLLNWAYASDERGDAFHSDIFVEKDGAAISDTAGRDRFAINVRWNVEDFGYIYITADNGGEFYTLPSSGEKRIDLIPELARSRMVRNRKRFVTFVRNGWKPSREVRTFLDVSEELHADAMKQASGELRREMLSQKSLYYAMWGSEMMELSYADFLILRRGRRPDFRLGCDARAFYQMYQPRFLDLFTEPFDFAPITYVIKGDDMLVDFEAEEGRYNYANRDLLFNALKERGITVEGRPLFWFHKWVTPDWLKKKSFDDLKKYVEKHTRDVIAHYGDGMYAWEIMNEFHDWANEVRCTPEQTVELTKLACDVARDTAPRVHRLINNCCPFAEYVQLGEWSGEKAEYRQRTPWQFTKDLVDAGVDFDILGQQMYFPYRDLQDIVINLERLESFGKPVQLSEVGCPGGPTAESVKTGKVKLSAEPYVWHRPWDEELAADWMESVFTLAYSRPFIMGANWFDFVDPYAYQENGGLLRSPEGEKKAAFLRLKTLRERWKNLPSPGESKL